MNELLGGRYQIIKKIGSGGMAIVYLAKDLSLDRKVAIKVLRDEYTEDSTFRRHFQKEAVAIAQLSHNNIVGIYDILTEDENMCLVMEYVEGETLKDKINRDGAIPWQLVVKYGIQIANALSYAHANQIIHKDVKSQNILIDKDDNVKITDFGISQMMNNTTITHNKGVLGSAHYFSPEQARGEKLSYQTDIYSLGIVLYEMLVGELPFTAENPVSVALKHIQEPAKPVHSIIHDVPESLSFIVSKCLEKKPENRFATMQALSRALSGVKAGSAGRAEAAKDKTMTKAVPITTAAMAAGVPKKTAPKEAAAQAAVKTPKDTVAKKAAGAATVAAAAKAAKNVKNKKLKEPNSQKKKTNFFVLAVIVLLVLGATIFIAQKIAPPSELTVPDFRGMTFEAAEKIADKRGLYLDEVGSEYSENYNEGEIISQTPGEGTNVSKGDTISVVISKGSQQATVPDVRGMTLEEATEKLEECDLKVGNVMESYSDTVKAGEIISQGYEPDVKIDRESEVNLEISLGESPYTIVPNCVGSDINSAKAMLDEAKLKVGNITYKKSESENNLVVEQSVEYGSKVDEYTTVDLVVSSGKTDDDDDDDGDAKAKSQRISFTAPSTGTMEIVLTDSQGTRVVDLKSVSEGDSIAGVYDYYGRGEFVIKIAGTVIQTIPVS